MTVVNSSLNSSDRQKSSSDEYISALNVRAILFMRAQTLAWLFLKIAEDVCFSNLDGNKWRLNCEVSREMSVIQVQTLMCIKI